MPGLDQLPMDILWDIYSYFCLHYLEPNDVGFVFYLRDLELKDGPMF